MLFCSYNVQYGTGKDGRVDFRRIAGEIGGADVVCLQEIERHFPATDEADQVAAVAAEFPKHHWVYGPGVDLDGDLIAGDGTVQHRRRQFGNMLLSRWPILSARNHLLPKHGLIQPLALQRSALEGVIPTGNGGLRVYSVHLGHSAADERTRQIATLLDIVRTSPGKGGAWSGLGAGKHWSTTGAPPPMPRPALLMGDFNLTPEDPEFDLLVGRYEPAYGRASALDGLFDCWTRAGGAENDGHTCLRPERGARPAGWARIDYAFATADLFAAVRAMRVDGDAVGSDHQPIFVDIDIPPA